MKKRKTINNKELKILDLIAKGYTSNEIAKALDCAVGTVELYVKNLMIKTNTVNRAHLVYQALKEKIIK